MRAVRNTEAAKTEPHALSAIAKSTYIAHSRVTYHPVTHPLVFTTITRYKGIIDPKF